MTDREKILALFNYLQGQHPEQRMGQILYNYVLAHMHNNDPFFITDADLYQAMKTQIEVLENFVIKD